MICRCDSDGYQSRARFGTTDQVYWHYFFVNSLVFHAATPDFDDKYERLGVRYTSVGEPAYFDPATEAPVEANGNGAANGSGIANGH